MPIKTVRSVTCSNCGRLYDDIDTGPYAETAKQARENARDYGNWTCKKVDGKMVDLCGRCSKATEESRKILEDWTKANNV